ncbi:MAG TPA: RodZ domain-containing protein [Gammaproteobacteria bacterium]
MTGEIAENSSLPGSRLRKQRERQGLTLAQAAHELHVDQRLLAALEDDDYATLGAPIFVKGHLRNYARLLGLDPAELVAEYEAAQQPADPTLVAHRPDGPLMDAHRERPWVGWIGWIFLLLLGVLLAAWWYYQQEGGADFTLSNMPDPVLLPDEPPAETSVPSETDESGPDASPAFDPGAASQDVPAEQGGVTVAPPEGETAANPRMEDAMQQPAEDTVQQAPPAAAPVTTPPAQTARAGLVLEFAEESWVEIYDAEGRPILYDLLGPGVRREINASGELRLFLGNAEGVEVYVNGEPFNVERFVRSDSTARFTVTVPAN